MDGEVEKNSKKKQIILILVGVVTLLVAILGATYAYFQINTNNNNTNTTITGSTPKSGLVTIKGVTDNLHINLSVSDMSYENRTKEYYGTDGKESYVETEELGTKTIAEVELTGGEATTKYSCTAKLTVSKVTEPGTDKDTMIEVLQPDDMILQFKGDIISDKLDLSELQETGSKEYNLSFLINGNAIKDIQAYIKLINKSTPQNYLAGRKLNVDISTSELKCDIKSTINLNDICNDKMMSECVKNKDNLKMLTNISQTTQGDMYRYQGTDNVGNWICFGTSNKDECIKKPNGAVPNGIDKYMYRIIGITEEGQMYLIKETFLREGNLGFAWNDKSYTSSTFSVVCENKVCPEWGQNTLFKRLNGMSNGETKGAGNSDNGNTDIFVDSEYYDYLKSGDNINGTKDNKGSKWYQLISYHNWMYGDTINDVNSANTYNGDYMYAIESGNAETTHYVDGKNTEDTYWWSKSVKATGKISLMYIHDYLYSYPGGNLGDSSTAKKGWLFSQKDGYNGYPYEWLSTRWGIYNPSESYVNAWTMFRGSFDRLRLDSTAAVRPVFYLLSNVKIKSGNGTKIDPYILDVQE